MYVIFGLLVVGVFLALWAGPLRGQEAEQIAGPRRYFAFATCFGKNDRGTGKIPAIVQIGHMSLEPDGDVTGLYYEVHNYALNSPLMPTGVSGPLGPVMRPRPGRVVYNPTGKISWTETGGRLTVKIGTITYNWSRGKDEDDPDRYEVQGFLPGEWSAGFGYFTEDVVSSNLKTDDLAYAYSGQQYVADGGVWRFNRQGAGISTYLFEPATTTPKSSPAKLLRYGFTAAGDGTGLQVGETIGLNCVPHSKLWMLAYGGHDFNRDGRITATGDGGHALTVQLIKRNGKLDRALYVENSWQAAGNNIVCVAWLSGLFLPPDLEEAAPKFKFKGRMVGPVYFGKDLLDDLLYSPKWDAARFVRQSRETIRSEALSQDSWRVGRSRSFADVHD